MKTVTFAKRWKHVISATSYAIYKPGIELVVSDVVAAIAHRDGVLKGDPVEAPEPEAPEADKPAKKIAKG